jgi:hypothetical protein
MAMPYAAAPPGEAAAREMMSRSLPMNLVQNSGRMLPGGTPAIVPAGFAEAGPMPLPHQGPIMLANHKGAGGPPMAGAVAAVGAVGGMGGPGGHGDMQARRTEVRFAAPGGMKVSWYAPSLGGAPGGFSSSTLDVPGRYNFLQAAIYRLKLSNIPDWPGLELYPTLEVVPSNGKTAAFLAHSAVPVVFTDEDLRQVSTGNYLVKVIYLPDPQFADLATTGPDEVVSTRLEPGADPIAEAHRRGNILLVIRMGNIDLEAPNTPAMDAPGPHGPHGMHGMPGMGMMPGLPPSPHMMPPGMMVGPGMARPGMPPQLPPVPGMGRPGLVPPQAPAAPSGPVSRRPEGPTVKLATYEVPADPVKAPAASVMPTIVPTSATTAKVAAKEEALPKASAPKKAASSGWKWWPASK